MARAGTEIFNPRTGQRMVFLETGAETNEELLRIDSRNPPSPPLEPEHVHPFQESGAEVISGSLRFRVGGEERTVGAGQTITIPPGAPYHFWNDGEVEAHSVQWFKPALNIDRFFESYFGLAQDDKLRDDGSLSFWQVAVMAPYYGDAIRLPSPPWAVQRALFGVLAPIGRMLGYRPEYPYPYGGKERPTVREDESLAQAAFEARSAVVASVFAVLLALFLLSRRHSSGREQERRRLGRCQREMGSVLGRAMRTTVKAALDRPGSSFALISVAAASAILGARRIKHPGSGQLSGQGLVSNEELVRLHDGRRVAIASHGDPKGRPLFLFHGTPGSRLGLHYVDGPANERGVRIVCPDRPGVGRSDPYPERTIPGYADDVSALADAMGFERFAVLGYSGGAPYALACGAKLPERVSAVGIMAGAGPHDRSGSREGCSKSDLMLLDLSLKQPMLARIVMFGWARIARYAPSVALKSLAEDVSDPDRQFLEEGVRERGAAEVMSLFTEVFRQGSGGVMLEYRLYGRPWGFSFEEVSVPVDIWHGEEDLVVPMHHAEDLASRLPDSRLHKMRDTGHFSIQQHYGTMLDALLST